MNRTIRYTLVAFTGKVTNPKMLQQLERLTELGELRGKQGKE